MMINVIWWRIKYILRLLDKNKFYSHPIYPDYYASKKGVIYCKKSGKILKLRDNSKGYLTFAIFHNSNFKNYYVHRYVYECLHGIIPKDKHVDHIDNNKINNNIKNLQLLIPKENIWKTHCKKLKSLNNKTKEICIYQGVRIVSKELCICAMSISRVWRKKQKTALTKDGIKYKFIYIWIKMQYSDKQIERYLAILNPQSTQESDKSFRCRDCGCDRFWQEMGYN